MSRARVLKEGSEETRRSWSRAAECRDFAPRDWTERSPAGIAKIEACTCSAKKGRILYVSSRSSHPSMPFSSLPFRSRFARLLSAALPIPFRPRNFSCALSSPSVSFRWFVPRRFRLVRFATPFSFSLLRLLLDRTSRVLLSFMRDASLRVALYLLPFARCLVVHAVTLFPSTHAANAVSRLAHIGYETSDVELPMKWRSKYRDMYLELHRFTQHLITLFYCTILFCWMLIISEVNRHVVLFQAIRWISAHHVQYRIGLNLTRIIIRISWIFFFYLWFFIRFK